MTPDWLQPPAIAALIGPSGLPARQVAVLNNVMSNARLGRLEAIEKFDATKAWPVAEYMAEVKRMIWQTPQGAAPDANRRALQRAYVARLGAIVNPPAPPPARGRRAPCPPRHPAAGPFLAPVNLAQSDLPALARAQLRAIQTVGEDRRGHCDNARAQSALVRHRRSSQRGTGTASIDPLVCGEREN